MGGYDLTDTSYTFSGKPQTVVHGHSAADKPSQLEFYTYSYDSKDRLMTVTHQLGMNAAVTLADYAYDPLGRLSGKRLHRGSGGLLRYTYNIKNWLTGISSTQFTQTLTYNNGTTGFNGNISSMNWSADGSNHSYAFTYDGANRMLDAIHGTGAYTEKVSSYDRNGNIMGLQRYGNGLIDNLTYTYNGNQLTQVEDVTGNSAGFSNGASTTNEYTYDYNGNLTLDSNKGICNIAWNSLNLPNVVTFTDGSSIVYSYAADGAKLRTVHNINGTITQKDYCGSVIYENGAAMLWQTEAGYISMNDSQKE